MYTKHALLPRFVPFRPTSKARVPNLALYVHVLYVAYPMIYMVTEDHTSVGNKILDGNVPLICPMEQGSGA